MKAIKHFTLVCKHRWYVFKNCCVAGLFWQGLTHDLSKYSPTEFFESVKYFSGDRSPIDNCKAVQGYSMAWLHHKGRNKHHYEYWQDNFDNGGTPLMMPFKYALEMICDYIGAGQAYEKKAFTFASELEWWKKKKSKPLAMHAQTQLFIDFMFEALAETNDKKFLKKKNAKVLYDKAYCLYIKKLSGIEEEQEKC